MSVAYWGVPLSVGFLLSACGTIPRTTEQGVFEISKLTKAVECELAMVALNPRYESFDLLKWGSKSSLDLTVVQSIGIDGKVIWTIAYSGGPTKVTPSLGLTGKHTSIAHIDFATSINAAIHNLDERCHPGGDPSDTGMRLASWFESTLQALQSGASHHAGMTYTAEFQISASATARYGYKLNLVDVDAGPGASRVDTNRLTVAVAPPPPPTKPTRVIIVGEQKSLIGPDVSGPAITSKKPGEKRQQRPSRRAPAIDDPTLNRLLFQRAPVRLEGQ